MVCLFDGSFVNHVDLELVFNKIFMFRICFPINVRRFNRARKLFCGFLLMVKGGVICFNDLRFRNGLPLSVNLLE